MRYKQDAPFELWYEQILKSLDIKDEKDPECWRVLYDLGFKEKEAINIATAGIK